MFFSFDKIFVNRDTRHRNSSSSLYFFHPRFYAHSTFTVSRVLSLSPRVRLKKLVSSLGPKRREGSCTAWRFGAIVYRRRELKDSTTSGKRNGERLSLLYLVAYILLLSPRRQILFGSRFSPRILYRFPLRIPPLYGNPHGSIHHPDGF